jgi:hypothetical protein
LAGRSRREPGSFGGFTTEAQRHRGGFGGENAEARRLRGEAEVFSSSSPHPLPSVPSCLRACVPSPPSPRGRRGSCLLMRRPSATCCRSSGCVYRVLSRMPGRVEVVRREIVRIHDRFVCVPGSLGCVPWRFVRAHHHVARIQSCFACTQQGFVCAQHGFVCAHNRFVCAQHGFACTHNGCARRVGVSPRAGPGPPPGPGVCAGVFFPDHRPPGPLLRGKRLPRAEGVFRPATSDTPKQAAVRRAPSGPRCAGPPPPQVRGRGR